MRKWIDHYAGLIMFIQLILSILVLMWVTLTEDIVLFTVMFKKGDGIVLWPLTLHRLVATPYLILSISFYIAYILGFLKPVNPSKDDRLLDD
jgi:hypothetical protein